MSNAADALARVSQMAEVLTTAQKKVLAAERALEEAEAELRRVSQEDFPDLLREVGLDEVKLSDGRKIVLSDDIECNISEQNKPRAFKWLRDRGYDGIIKTELVLSFGKGDDAVVKAILEAVDSLRDDDDIGGRVPQPELKDSVHWQTLKSFVKERRAVNEEGKVPPDDLFGVHPNVQTLVAEPGKKAAKLKRMFHRKKND